MSMHVVETKSGSSIEKIESRIQQLKTQSDILQNSYVKINSPKLLEKFEQKIHTINREISDLITAKKIQENIDQESSKQEALDLARLVSKKK